MTANADKAADSVLRFQAWAADREKTGDWTDYIRGGRLNRSEVAKECQFGRAAWLQNPTLATALGELERQLAGRGVLSAAPLDVASLSPEVQAEVGMADEKVRRAMSARATLEKRVKSLEEQNATLRAENRDLRERLRRSALADIHLAETGRLLP
jgi:hypothetical protein